MRVPLAAHTHTTERFNNKFNGILYCRDHADIGVTKQKITIATAVWNFKTYPRGFQSFADGNQLWIIAKSGESENRDELWTLHQFSDLSDTGNEKKDTVDESELIVWFCIMCILLYVSICAS